MKFRTEIEIPTQKVKIQLNDRLLSLGSCFTENISKKLDYLKFNIISNPFGIIYNPESIATSLEMILNKKVLTESDLFEYNGIWNSFYHHSKFSNSDKETALTNINKEIEQANRHFMNADILLLTFGTSWVYELKQTGKIVSNCHKIPSKEFNRYSLTVSEITKQYTALINKIHNLNPRLQIIFTVSPVRHLKDGFHENQISKSTLLLAIDALVKIFDFTNYFPAYEIMVDDLRDYRYYNDDMVHPSSIAVEYIWEKFINIWIDKKWDTTINSIIKIKQAVLHRPFQPNTTAYQQFLKKNIQTINSIKSEYPFLDLNIELSFFESRMI